MLDNFGTLSSINISECTMFDSLYTTHTLYLPKTNCPLFKKFAETCSPPKKRTQ